MQVPQYAKTLLLSALGGALEFYDFIIFVFFAAVIGELFFPPDMPDWLRQLQTFGIFAAGYLARPLGGVIMAHFGDLVGRKYMFMLSIFLMALPTLAIGLLPTYVEIGLMAPVALLLLRVLQGAAIGGEVPGAWVFVSEHAPENKIGLACGVLTAGLVAGILLGSLMAMAIHQHYTAAQIMAEAWRIPFLVGGVFGLVSVWLRQWLHETPVFMEMKAKQQLANEVPLRQVLREQRSAIILTMLLTWQLSAAIVVMILMTPTLIQKLFAIPAPLALQANSVAVLFLIAGCVVYGAAADRFGAAKVLILGSFLLALSSEFFYQQLALTPENIQYLYALCGFCVGVVGVIPSIAVRAFPAPIRFTGLSFSYNVAYAVFGGLTPIIVSLGITVDSLAPAHYVEMVCLTSVLTGGWLVRKAALVSRI